MAGLLSWIGNTFDNGWHDVFGGGSPQNNGGGLNVSSAPQQQRPVQMGGLRIQNQGPQIQRPQPRPQPQPLRLMPMQQPQLPVAQAPQQPNVAQRVWNQVNPFDNGRTFQNPNPNAAHQGSIMQQATHNGLTNATGQVVKGFTNIAAAPIEVGRSVAAMATHNPAAELAAANRAKLDAQNNIVTGIGHQIAGTAQGLYDVVGKQTAATVTNNPTASANATTAAVRDFNKTPFGQVLDPLQHKLAAYQVHRDLPQLSKPQQNQVIKQNQANVGIDPTASLGKQSLTAGLAGLNLIVPDKIVNGVPITKDLANKTNAASEAVQKFSTTPTGKTLAAVGEKVPVGLGTKKVSSPPGGKLPDKPANYFQTDKQTQMVPVKDLQLTKAGPDVAQSAAVAHTRMQQAAGGAMDKRAPLLVHKAADGTLSVLDGNATATVAKANGWKQIPAHIVTSAAAPGADHVSAVQGLIDQAHAVNEHFQNNVKSIADQNGFAHVPGPVKGVARTLTKVMDDYKGNHNAVKDTVRATIPLTDHSPGMLQQIVDHITANHDVHEIKNPTFQADANGYRDMKAVIKMPNGHKGEILMSTPEMLHAKSNLGGHKLYEISRDQTKTAAEKRAAAKQMRTLYKNAHEEANNRLASSGSVPTASKALSASASEAGRAPSGKAATSLETPVNTLTSRNSPSGKSETLSTTSSSVTNKSDITDHNIPPTGKTTNAGGQGKPSRFTKVTVPNSAEVSQPVKEQIKQDPATYETTGNPDQAAKSEAFLKQNGLKSAAADVMGRLSVEQGKIDHQTVSDAIATAKRLDGTGTVKNQELATHIYNSLAEHGSKLGQAIQALTHISNRTPEGAKFAALRELDKAGVKLDKPTKQVINSIIGEFKAAPAGSKERALAGQKLINFVNNKLPRSKIDAVSDIWRAGLLTGPETAVKVAVSHGITAPTELAAKPVMAGVDKGFTGVAKGLRAAGITHVGKLELTGERGFTFSPKDYATFAKTAVTKGIPSAAYKMATGLDLPDTGGFESKLGSGHHQTFYEKIPFRLHGSIFKPNYAGEFATSLAEQARTMAINKRLSGDARNAFIRDFVTNPSAQAISKATQDAELFTNMQRTQGGAFASAIAGFKPYGVPVGRFLAPFTRIPTAIAGKGIVDYTPLGLGKGTLQLINGIRTGKFDQRMFSQTIGRGIVGTGIVATGAALMGSGRMTLQAPNDPKEKELWALQGKQKNSIYVGGTVTKDANGVYHYKDGTHVSLNAGGPLGIAMGLGGAFEQAIRGGQNSSDATISALAGAGKLVADQPYFKGVSGAANAITNPKQYANSFIQSLAGSAVPAGVSQVARGTDPQQRAYPNNIPDTFKSEIPGARETLPAQQNLFGQTLKGSGGSLGGDINGVLNPLYPSKAINQNDSVATELQRLYNNLDSQHAPTIALPNKNMTINGQKTKLTVAQLQNYIAAAGPELHQGIQNLLNNPQYQQLSDQEKSKQINTVIDASRTAQRVQQLGDNPKSLTAADRTALANPDKLGNVINVGGKLAPQDKYQQALLKYQQQKASGQLTSVQDFKDQSTLGKEKITSNFSGDVTSLYGMSKAKIASYLSQNPGSADQTYAQLQSLDTQLYNAGVISKPKFASGIVKSGSTYTAVKSTSSRGSGSRTGTARAKRLTLPHVSGVKGYGGSVAFRAPKAFKVRAPKVRTPKLASARTTTRSAVPGAKLVTPKINKKAVA